MEISVEGIGTPILPVNFAIVSGLMHTTGDASVRPYPSIITEPVVSCQRSATGFCSAIPPEITNCKCEKSILEKLFFRKIFTNNLISRGLVINKAQEPTAIKKKQPVSEKI